MQNKTKGFSQISILLVALAVVGLGFVVFQSFSNQSNQNAQVLDSNLALSTNLQSEMGVDKVAIPAPAPFVVAPAKKGETISASTLEKLKTIQLSVKQKANELSLEYNKNLSKKVDTSLEIQVTNKAQKVESSNTDRGGPAPQNLRPRILYMGGATDRVYSNPTQYLTQYNNDVWDLTNGQVIPPASAAINPGVAPGPWGERVGFNTVYFNNKVWLIGGWNSVECRNDVWSSIDGGRNWFLVMNNAPFPSRSGFTLTVFQNKMYVIGGSDCDGNIHNDVWSSTDGSNWSLVTTTPMVARVGHQTVVYQNKLVITGGFTSSQGYMNNVISSSNGQNWANENISAPWSRRANHSSQVLNGKIYVFGGIKLFMPTFSVEMYMTPIVGASNWFNQANFVTDMYSDVWSSSDGGATWLQETTSAPWGPREEQSSVVMNNRIYLIGGSKDPWGLPVFAEHDFWNYDGINWIQVTPSAPWIERGNASAVVVPPGFGDGFFPPIPNVSTMGPNNITNTSIDLLGSFTSTIPNIEWWFEHNIASNFYYIINQSTVHSIASSSQTVSSMISSLIPQTMYSDRLVAQNSTGISYGPRRSSRTAGCQNSNPSVRIIFPNGSGESFITGQQINITWETCNVSSSEPAVVFIPGWPSTMTNTLNDLNESFLVQSNWSGQKFIQIFFPNLGVSDWSDAPFQLN